MFHRMRAAAAPHQRALLIGLVLWLLMWGSTMLTWQFLPDGTPVGMDPRMFVLHLVFPACAAGVVGWWRGRPAAGIPLGIIVGVLLAVLDILVLALGDWFIVWLGLVKIPPDSMTVAESLFELVEFTIIFGVVAAISGAIAAAIGGGLALIRPRHHG